MTGGCYANDLRERSEEGLLYAKAESCLCRCCARGCCARDCARASDAHRLSGSEVTGPDHRDTEGGGGRPRTHSSPAGILCPRTGLCLTTAPRRLLCTATSATALSLVSPILVLPPLLGLAALVVVRRQHP
jgi:hypothetical protein